MSDSQSSTPSEPTSPVQSAPSASDMAPPTQPSAPAQPPMGTEPAGSLARREDEPGRLTDSELESLLFADPFKKTPEPQGNAPADPTPSAQREPQKQGAAPSTAPPQGLKGQAPAPPAAVQTPPAPGPDPRDQELANLRAEMQQVRMLMQNTIQQQAPTTAEPTRPAGPLADPNIPAYLFNLPEDLLNGIQAEDPMIRKASLQAMIQGMAKSIHYEVMDHARKEMEQVIPGRVEALNSKTREADGIRNDYFSAFPNHRAVQELVGSVTRQVFAETGSQGWTPGLRNAIGQRVNLHLSQALPPQQPTAAPAPAPAFVPAAPPPAQAPFIFGTSASPAVGPAAGSNPNAPVSIFDTLFG